MTASHRSHLALWLVIAVLWAGSAVRADYRESFRRGYQAIDRERWEEAVRWLQEAAAEQPREGGERIRISGGFVRDYLPHFYLGVAFFNQGKLDLAARHWVESRAQGIVLQLPEGKDLGGYLSRPEVVSALAAQTADPLPAKRDIAENSASSDRAAGLPSPRPLPPAANAVPAPGGSTAGVERTSPDSTVPPTPSIPIRPVVVPAELRSAARAYFEARYQEALKALSGLDYSEQQLALQARLIRAATQFTLYVIGGERDDRLRQLAIDEVRACHASDPDFRPDPQAFSPRFQTFFDAAVAERR